MLHEMRAVLVAMAVTFVGCSSGSGGASGSSGGGGEFHLSAEAAPKAETLWRTIETDLAAACTVAPEGKNYTPVVARARRELAALQGAAKTKADRAAMLLLASVLMRDRERCTIVQMGAPADHVAEQQAERTPCAAELAPWLEGQGSEALLQTPCLVGAEKDEETLLNK